MANKYVKAGVQPLDANGLPDLVTPATTLTSVAATEFRLSVDHQVVYLTALNAYNPYNAVYGTMRAGDSFTIYAIPGQIDIFMEAIFGAKNGVDTNSDGIIDYYEYSLDVPKALTLEIGDELGKAYRLTGVIITSAELSFDIRDVMKFTGNFIARYVEEVTHAYVAPDLAKPYVIWDTTITIDGATFKLREFSMTIDRGINEDAYVIGSRFLDALEWGEMNVSGSGRLAPSEFEEFKRAIFGSTTATVPQNEPTQANIVITARTPDGANSMTINLPTVVYPTGGLDLSATEFSTRDFDWRLVGDAITVQLQ